MSKIPVIVISSSVEKTGKTTLALNLAAALWSDEYTVKIWAPQNETVANFMQKRQALCAQSQVELPLPEIIGNIDENSDNNSKAVIIAIVPTSENQQYSSVFAKAHTLISVGNKCEDLQWNLSDSYVSLVWEAKKNIAARGVKYLNWIAVLNMAEKETDIAPLSVAAKKFGFRTAAPIMRREPYRYVENGYCAADMAKYRQLFKMSMEDVYARREILTFTDFLWQ